jgi:hypothetical protein
VRAFILQFSLPGWKIIAGVSRIPAEKKANIDLPRLRRWLGIILFVAAAGFLAGAVALYLNLLPQSLVFPLFFIFIIVVYDALYIAYRKCDRNEWPPQYLHAGRVVLLMVNIMCLFLALFFRG